jgi:hypothetical protein
VVRFDGSLRGEDFNVPPDVREAAAVEAKTTVTELPFALMLY